MRQTKWLIAVSMLCLALVAGCNENTVDPIDPTAPSAPTAAMASSRNLGVALKWTSSTSSSVFKYVIRVYDASNTNQFGSDIVIDPVPGTTQMYTCTGLVNGTIYTFRIYATSGTSVTDMAYSGALEIKWAPAYVQKSGIRVYEYDSNMGSGLSIYDPADGEPMVYTVANGSKWDIALLTKPLPNNEISYDVGTVETADWNSIPSPKNSKISTTVYSNTTTPYTTVDDMYDSEMLSSKTFAKPQYWNFYNKKGTAAATELKQGFGFAVMTASGIYAKVFVKYNGTSILQGTAPNRYIDCEISYQTSSNIPYALIDQPAVKNDNAVTREVKQRGIPVGSSWVK